MSNDFSQDINCKAVWNFDDGALTTDSKGTNTLTDNNTVGQSADCKQGDRSADFESTNSEYLSITDANLDSGFPFKNGDTKKEISICLWFKLESINTTQYLIAKYGFLTQSIGVLVYSDNTLKLFLGYGDGSFHETISHGSTLSAGIWYHVGITYRDSDKSYKIRIWDDDASDYLGEDVTGNATNNINIENAQFCIGSNSLPAVYFDGLIDEVVVFNKILVFNQIDEIRQGTYIGYQIKSAIKQNKNEMFRRLYFKRRIGGEYDDDWQPIPQKYIIKFGTNSFSIDDIKANFLKFSGLTFQVDNKDGYFADTVDSKSIFYNVTSIMKTLVKVECGYNFKGYEYPLSSTVYLGIVGEDYKYVEDSKVSFSTKHLSSVFDDVPADQLPGLTNSAYTASEIMTKIKDFEDSNAVKVFQKYITSGGWNISTTTDTYTFATISSLQNMTCWDLMKKLSEAENKVCYIDQRGDFYFTAKATIQDSATYHFSGIGDSDKSFGHNIIKLISVDDNFRKVYNRIRVQYDEEDTSTSYKIKKEDWAWGDSTSSFVYGVRTYDYKNVFMSEAKASETAISIYNEYSQPKKEVTVKTKYVPQLFVNDRVSLTYKTKRVEGDFLWGHFLWGYATWGERKGYNINIENQDFRITSIEHNFDNFSSKLILREI